MPDPLPIDPDPGPTYRKVYDPNVGCAAGCGACCDPVILPFETLRHLTMWTEEKIAGYPDPRTEEGWQAWRDVGWADEHRELVRWRMRLDRDTANADFADAHWTQYLGPEREDWGAQIRVACDALDPVTRRCTVHDGGQPPVCTGYPHYGLEPGDTRINYGVGMDPVCTYNGEVRRMLPIIEVRSG